VPRSPPAQDHGLVSVRLLQPGEDPDAPPGTIEWTTRAGLIYRRSPALPVPPALRPALVRVPAGLAQERHAEAARLRDLNARVRAAQARAHNRRLDDHATGRPPDDDQAIEQPPAAIDDDPAPPLPQRPLETWNHSLAAHDQRCEASA
jgi:hypothetical protein